MQQTFFQVLNVLQAKKNEEEQLNKELKIRETTQDMVFTNAQDNFEAFYQKYNQFFESKKLFAEDQQRLINLHAYLLKPTKRSRTISQIVSLDRDHAQDANRTLN